MKKIMKKIVMTVLVIATVLSGLTVPTRKAEALRVEKTSKGWYMDLQEKLKELKGNDELGGYCVYSWPKVGDSYFDITWLSDKDGNVIVDDRVIGVYADGESHTDNSDNVIVDNYPVIDMTQGFTIHLSCKEPTDCLRGIGISPYFDAVWSSDNPEIAEVAQDGTVTAKKAGKTVIRATVTGKGKEITREINVINNEVTKKWKISKGKADSVLCYDKDGNAICKVTIKNTSRKKYKYFGSIRVKDGRYYSDTSMETLKKYKYKITLKPGKSKTIVFKVKKLKGYQDLTVGGLYVKVGEQRNPVRVK